jgi:hypothetical protein
MAQEGRDVTEVLGMYSFTDKIDYGANWIEQYVRSSYSTENMRCTYQEQERCCRNTWNMME